MSMVTAIAGMIFVLLLLPGNNFSNYLDIGPKPDGEIGEPYYAGCVTGKPNELRLVEVFRNIPGGGKI